MSDIVEVHIKYDKQTKDLEMRCPERKAMRDPRVAVGCIVLPPSMIGGNGG